MFVMAHRSMQMSTPVPHSLLLFVPILRLLITQVFDMPRQLYKELLCGCGMSVIPCVAKAVFCIYSLRKTLQCSYALFSICLLLKTPQCSQVFVTLHRSSVISAKLVNVLVISAKVLGSNPTIDIHVLFSRSAPKAFAAIVALYKCQQWKSAETFVTNGKIYILLPFFLKNLL